MEPVRLKGGSLLKHIVLLGLLGLAIFAATFGGLYFFTSNREPAQTLESMQSKVDFPLFGFKTLPTGFKQTSNPIMVEGTAVTTSFETQGKTIIVTQQKRPKFMEEVDKTKQWQAPAGSAYTANLNNKAAGFIVTQSTLLIFSSSNGASVDQLAELMNSASQL